MGYNESYSYDYGWQLRKKGLEYYSSSKFCGVCPQQPERYLHLQGLSLNNRLKLLFQPKGYLLSDAFVYKLREKGLFCAVLSACHILFKVFFKKEK